MVTEKNTLFQLAADYVQYTNESIFLTGKAGTGKTTFLKYIKENCGKNCAVVAPTGVAAINAGGTTIHSFFQLPFTPFIPENSVNNFGANNDSINNETVVDKHHLLGRIKLNRDKREIIKQLELLIIDEISMVRADTLDAIDTVLKHIRGKHSEPFGGVQLLLIGDMFQLPPVVPNNEMHLLNQFYNSPYFFSSRVIQNQPPIYIELEKIYRQSDDVFISVLNKVRNNQMDENALEVLNSLYNTNFTLSPNDGYIILTTHNQKAATTNKAELENITKPLHSFEAVIEGNFGEQAFPADQVLQIKVGSQVMFIKNDKEKIRRYFNGKIGTVSKIENREIYVQCKGDTDTIKVDIETWENIQYNLNQTNQQIEEKTIGSFKQYPLRLAWAITIHKSQGLTFEKAIIDAGAAFAPGQVYVALSRCTSLEGIILQSKITTNSLQTDDRIIQFSATKSNTLALNSNLLFSKQIYQEKIIVDLFSFGKALDTANDLYNFVLEHKSMFNAEAISWAKDLHTSLSELQHVAIKFQTQLKQFFALQENQKISERIIKATEHFVPQLDAILSYISTSTAITDSKNFAIEFYNLLKTIYCNIYTNHQLISTCKNGFTIESYQEKKLTLQIPNLVLHVHSAQQSKTINSPHPLLYNQLKNIRDHICATENLPIYYVANSNTITEMCTYLPQTLDDLEQLSGFGSKKIAKYGKVFLDCILSYSQEHNLTTTISNKKVSERKNSLKNTDAGVKENTLTVTYKLFIKNKNAEEIAKERALATSTIEGHLAQLIKNKLITVEQVLDSKKLNAILDIIGKNEKISTTEIINNCNVPVSYSEIRYVMNSLPEKVV